MAVPDGSPYREARVAHLNPRTARWSVHCFAVCMYATAARTPARRGHKSPIAPPGLNQQQHPPARTPDASDIAKSHSSAAPLWATMRLRVQVLAAARRRSSVAAGSTHAHREHRMYKVPLIVDIFWPQEKRERRGAALSAATCYCQPRARMPWRLTLDPSCPLDGLICDTEVFT